MALLQQGLGQVAQHRLQLGDFPAGAQYGGLIRGGVIRDWKRTLLWLVPGPREATFIPPLVQI